MGEVRLALDVGEARLGTHGLERLVGRVADGDLDVEGIADLGVGRRDFGGDDLAGGDLDWTRQRGQIGRHDGGLGPLSAWAHDVAQLAVVFGEGQALGGFGVNGQGHGAGLGRGERHTRGRWRRDGAASIRQWQSSRALRR